jgi:hypothetical protein
LTPCLKKKQQQQKKNPKKLFKRNCAGREAQVVRAPASKPEALSSNPSTEEKKKRKETLYGFLLKFQFPIPSTSHDYWYTT